jgi:uncharacterized protein (UPF0303 family)
MTDDIWAGITFDGLAAEEADLRFAQFTHEDAWRIGSALVEKAQTQSLPIAIDITRNGQQLFHAALEGSKPDNDVWIQRKTRAVLRFWRSSLALSLECRQTGKSLAESHNVDAQLYVAAGGCFPVHVEGAGVIGTITVSGLPQVEDHRLIVAAIRQHLGRP